LIREKGNLERGEGAAEDSPGWADGNEAKAAASLADQRGYQAFSGNL